MAHNIDMSNDRANIAFMGSRGDIWHRLGQQMQAGMTVEQWAKAAGLDWEAIKVPAIASLEGSRFDHLDPSKRFTDTGLYFNARNDTGGIISGALSDRHCNVQPVDVLNFFDRYISVDPRFALDVAGSLRGGATIWATATFNGGVDIAGDKHLMRVLMTTTFDGSGATINKGTATRVVCNNTLDVSLADRRCEVRTRHNTKFDAAKVGRELAQIAQGFVQYKAIGDALATAEMAKEEVSKFFKDCLDIPFDVPAADISARKMGQFQDLTSAYRTSVGEGAPAGSAWAALQAITRYVDHDRSTRAGDVSVEQARFASAQFGSGAAVKAKAMQLLLPRIKDKVPVAA